MIAVSLVLAAVIIACIAFVGRRSEGDRTAAPLTVVRTSAPLTTAPADAAAAVAEAVRAIDGLLAAPGVRIVGTSLLDDLGETFRLSLDATTGSYSSVESIVDPDGMVRSALERVNQPPNMYLRPLLASQARPGPWNVIPSESVPQVAIDMSYTLFGRITPRLSQLAAMFQTVSFVAQRITAGKRSGYRLSAPADDVARYLTEHDLALVSEVPAGSCVWDLLIEGDRLVQLVGSGVQFFSGETFNTSLVHIDYEFVTVHVERPAPDATQPG